MLLPEQQGFTVLLPRDLTPPIHCVLIYIWVVCSNAHQRWDKHDNFEMLYRSANGWNWLLRQEKDAREPISCIPTGPGRTRGTSSAT